LGLAVETALHSLVPRNSSSSPPVLSVKYVLFAQVATETSEYSISFRISLSYRVVILNLSPEESNRNRSLGRKPYQKNT
jgi:hypothetical protein